MYPKFENHWFNPYKLENESHHQPKKIFSPYYVSTRNWRRYKALHSTVLALGGSQSGWRTDQESLICCGLFRWRMKIHSFGIFIPKEWRGGRALAKRRQQRAVRNQRAPELSPKVSLLVGLLHSFCIFVYIYFYDQKKPYFFQSARIGLTF